MIKNNIEADVNCIGNGVTQVQLVEKIEVVGGYVKRILEKRMDKMMDMNFNVSEVFQERLASSMGLDKYRYINGASEYYQCCSRH